MLLRSWPTTSTLAPGVRFPLLRLDVCKIRTKVHLPKSAGDLGQLGAKQACNRIPAARKFEKQNCASSRWQGCFGTASIALDSHCHSCSC